MSMAIDSALLVREVVTLALSGDACFKRALDGISTKIVGSFPATGLKEGSGFFQANSSQILKILAFHRMRLVYQDRIESANEKIGR